MRYSRHKLLELSTEELEEILKKEYLKLSDKLMSYILDLYMSILNEEGIPLNSHLYQFNKYYDLLNKVQDELTKLGIKENKVMEDKLVNLYEQNTKMLDQQFNLATDLRTKDIIDICRRDWVGDGMNFSDRI